MKITYDETSRLFKIDTLRSSYCIGITDEEKFLLRLSTQQRLAHANGDAQPTQQAAGSRSSATEYQRWPSRRDRDCKLKPS